MKKYLLYQLQFFMAASLRRNPFISISMGSIYQPCLKKIIFSSAFLITVFFCNAQVAITNLRCEMLQNPLGIDVLQPRLSWQLESKQRNVVQQSYQIIVSSSMQKLQTNNGDVWNSGVITSSQSAQVYYAGKPLQSATTYYWKIKSITNKGTTNSSSAFFSTGLLNESDWKAKWIGYDKASPWDSITQWSRLSARYLRKEFTRIHSSKKSNRLYLRFGYV